MANTTNFNWATPDDTDLVKDGAAAIRTLGSSIDTSFVDLKGGTTGQVLSKASNTDLDYTWVTTDDANAIQNAIVDAKGDLIAASANDTPARLAVGNNGETLVADSSTTTGLRYNPSIEAGKNFIINGNFDIWQRGTSQTVDGYGSADRFYVQTSNLTTTQQTTGAPNGSRYIMRCASTAASAFGGPTQMIETDNCSLLWGRTVTASIKIRRDATLSTPINLILQKNSTVNAAFGTAGWSTIASQQASTAQMPTGSTSSDWYTLSFTTTIPNDGTANTLRLRTTFQNATVASGEYIELSQMQLEVGSVVTTFSRAGGTLAGELAACMRYFYSLNSANNVYSNFGNGVYSSSTIAQIIIPLPVPMRVTPSISVGTVGNYAVDGVAGNNCSNLVTGQLSPQVIGLSATTAASTTGYACYLRAANTLNAAIQISAEL